VLIAGAGAVVATVAGVKLVDRPEDEQPHGTTPGVAKPPRTIPADAVWVAPGGNDDHPGTRDKPRATAMAGAFNVMLGGVYSGYSQMLPDGTVTTLMVADGQTATLDGRGTLVRAITAGGKLDLYGDLHITNYAPQSTHNGSNAPLYFGGTAAGSEIDGLTISNSRMAGLGFQVPLVITKLVVDTCGYSGIMGTTADGTVFGDVGVYRVNRDGYAQDGQLAAIKVTRSADLVFTRAVHVEDHGSNGAANGIWTDVSCRNPVVVGAKVLTGAGHPPGVGLLIEETEGGIIAGTETEGRFATILRASGHVRFWANKATGTSVALAIVQDRPKNTGIDDLGPNLSQRLAPWWAVSNEVCNNELVATGADKVALMVFAYGPATGELSSGQMLAALRGNAFVGSVQLGSADGGRVSYPASQLTAALGETIYSTAAQPVPADIAALLAE
jgi:hypothetical protein